MTRLAVAAALIALALAAPATAGNVAPEWLATAAAEEAGHPVAVWCESDGFAWDTSIVRRFYPRGGDPVLNGFYAGDDGLFLAPGACLPLVTGPSSARFAFGLYVLLHEAGHATGTHDETTADCLALEWLPTILFDVLRVPWFSPAMRRVWNGAAIAALEHRDVPTSCLRVLRV